MRKKAVNPRSKMNPAEKLIDTKKRLVKRLNEEIVLVRKRSAFDVRKIRLRIRIAQTLLSALEKGTLKA